MEKAQLVYQKLMLEDANFNLTYRWDVIDKDSKNTFWFASDFIDMEKYSSVTLMIKSGCLDLVKEKEFESVGEIDSEFYHNSRYDSIHHAVMSGNLDMVKYFVSLGANLNSRVHYVTWKLYVASDYHMILNPNPNPNSSLLDLLSISYHDLKVRIEIAECLFNQEK